MALTTALPQLETDIEQLLLELSTSTDPAAARRTYAQKMAAAIHKFTRQGLVQTTGTAAAQSGTIQ